MEEVRQWKIYESPILNTAKCIVFRKFAKYKFSGYTVFVSTLPNSGSRIPFSIFLSGFLHKATQPFSQDNFIGATEQILWKRSSGDCKFLLSTTISGLLLPIH